MGQVDRVMVAARRQLVEQRARLAGVAPGQHDHEAMARQCGHDGPGSAAGAHHPGHSEQVGFRQPRRERFEEARHISVIAGQPAVSPGHHGVDRANPRRQRIDRVKQGHHRLLVRHRHIATAPQRITAPGGDGIGQASGRDVATPIVRGDAQRVQPEAMDRRRLRLHDRIADHFGIWSARRGQGHCGSIPRARRAPCTASSGMPSTVK